MDKSRLESLRRQHAVALEEFRECPTSDALHKHLCDIESRLKGAGCTVEYDAEGNVSYEEAADA